MANCEETIAELSAFLDGEVDEGRLVELSEHLQMCLSCDDRKCFEEKLKALVRDRCAEKMPAEVLERLRERIASVNA